MLQFSLDEDQWEQDWAVILSIASQPGQLCNITYVRRALSKSTSMHLMLHLSVVRLTEGENTV